MSNFTSNYDYNKIVNPETNRTVNINSRTGKKVLEKYKNLLNISQHGGNKGAEWMDISDKIPIINKHGKTYYGIFINGNKWHDVRNEKNLVAHSLVQSNTGYFKKSEKWRFDPAEGALREREKCGVLLPKKKGCYSMIVIDPDFKFKKSGVPGIAGYIIASHHKTNKGLFTDTPFIYIDYVEVSTDYQGEGLCRPMVSSIINKFITDYGITSFKIWNASRMRGPARSCYIKAADENGLDIYHTPYYLNDGGNFPVYICGTCKVNMDKLKTPLVNGDEPEYYYMVPKDSLKKYRLDRGSDIACDEFYPDPIDGYPKSHT